MAVYAYAHEDYDWWSAELGRDLEPGSFGENLTLRGVDVTGAVIGERWRIGSATFTRTGRATKIGWTGRRVEASMGQPTSMRSRKGR